MNAAIIGQEAVVERLLIAFLADGRVLMESLPGVAKTRSIKTLGKLIESEFQRVQFAPDLLPSDVIGSEIYREQNGSFDFQPGPVFGNLVLADKINRASRDNGCGQPTNVCIGRRWCTAAERCVS